MKRKSNNVLGHELWVKIWQMQSATGSFEGERSGEEGEVGEDVGAVTVLSPEGSSRDCRRGHVAINQAFSSRKSSCLFVNILSQFPLLSSISVSRLGARSAAQQCGCSAKIKAEHNRYRPEAQTLTAGVYVPFLCLLNLAALHMLDHHGHPWLHVIAQGCSVGPRQRRLSSMRGGLSKCLVLECGGRSSDVDPRLSFQ